MGPIRAQGNRRRWGGRQGNETARSLPARKNWRHEQLKAHQYGSLPGENYCVWGQEDVVSAPPWCRGRGLGMQLLQLPRLWGRPELRDGRAALKTRAVELLLLPKGVGTQSALQPGSVSLPSQSCWASWGLVSSHLFADVSRIPWTRNPDTQSLSIQALWNFSRLSCSLACYPYPWEAAVDLPDSKVDAEDEAAASDSSSAQDLGECAIPAHARRGHEEGHGLRVTTGFAWMCDPW